MPFQVGRINLLNCETLVFLEKPGLMKSRLKQPSQALWKSLSHAYIWFDSQRFLLLVCPIPYPLYKALLRDEWTDLKWKFQERLLMIGVNGKKM